MTGSGTKTKTNSKSAKRGKPAKGRARKPAPTRLRAALRGLARWAPRVAIALPAIFLVWIASYSFINPITTPYMFAEARRLGGVEQSWADLEDISAALPKAVAAAEDANFCLHWGFDMGAIRQALDEGAARGASTLTQQVVKNAFLWHGRSWPRKALEALITPVAELFYTKRRIIELYLNIAEFGPGIFGAEAAAQHFFGKSAGALTMAEAARLAAILPDPKNRSPRNDTAFMRKRSRAIADGAATITADGRAACFSAN